MIPTSESNTKDETSAVLERFKSVFKTLSAPALDTALAVIAVNFVSEVIQCIEHDVNNIFIFIARQHAFITARTIFLPQFRPSVSLTVTRRYCVKTVKNIV